MPTAPNPLLLQVRSYFTLCWRRSPAPFDELRILRDVHGPLRARILKHIGTRARAKIPIMQVQAAVGVLVHFHAVKPCHA
jgi:hypothetical protein